VGRSNHRRLGKGGHLHRELVTPRATGSSSWCPCEFLPPDTWNSIESSRPRPSPRSRKQPAGSTTWSGRLIHVKTRLLCKTTTINLYFKSGLEIQIVCLYVLVLCWVVWYCAHTPGHIRAHLTRKMFRQTSRFRRRIISGADCRLCPKMSPMAHGARTPCAYFSVDSSLESPALERSRLETAPQGKSDVVQSRQDGGFYPTRGRVARNERQRERETRKLDGESSVGEGPSGVSTGTTTAKVRCAVTSEIQSPTGCE
jgi:hypothetical protein